MQDRSSFEPRRGRARWVPAALAAALVLVVREASAEVNAGLRWVGDARAAASAQGAAAFGPALRFRYGAPSADVAVHVALPQVESE